MHHDDMVHPEQSYCNLSVRILGTATAVLGRLVLPLSRIPCNHDGTCLHVAFHMRNPVGIHPLGLVAWRSLFARGVFVVFCGLLITAMAVYIFCSAFVWVEKTFLNPDILYWDGQTSGTTNWA